MQLSVIIVNYNVKYFLEHCLLSVIKACSIIDAEILVVDNNSTDGSSTYFKNKFPQVKFYWLTENLGFGKANNYALQYATGEHILFLNPDTIVGENCFVDCIKFFKSKKDCGALGVRMIDGAGNFLKESKRGFPKVAVGFYKAIGLAKIFPKTFGQYHATHLPEKENNRVEVLAGAFMMLSKKAIEFTKGFDEDFFMYGEDIDLSYRVKKVGLQNYYFGEKTIVHFKGESTKKKGDAYFNNFYGAMKLFVDKHNNKNKLWKGFIYLGIFIRKNVGVFKNKFKREAINIDLKSTLIIGNKTEVVAAKKLLENSSTKITLIDTNSKNDLQYILQNEKTDQIIFCNLLCTYEYMLESMNECINEFKSISFGFYSKQTNTIVGSSNKDKSGFVIF